MNHNVDTIEISLPFKAEYVSIARLAASGISNRVGFDIETIEDIKVAIAEVCNKLVKAGRECEGHYTLTFNILPDSIEVIFRCENKNIDTIFSEDEEELGISIIKALMDKVQFNAGEGKHILIMTKTLERK